MLNAFGVVRAEGLPPPLTLLDGGTLQLIVAFASPGLKHLDSAEAQRTLADARRNWAAFLLLVSGVERGGNDSSA